MITGKSSITVSIIIPCFKEKNNIRDIIGKVLAAPLANKEIIVVDDGSTPETLDILRKEIEPLVTKVIYHEKNKGKGAALRTGFAVATGDVVIVQDADLEYDPMEIPTVLAPIERGETDVAYGSRFLIKPKNKGYILNYIANRFLTVLSNLKTGLRLTDMQTCYKAFRREIIQSLNLQENRFGFDPEVTALVAKRGHNIVEVPISYNPRTFKEGKKIGWRDGLRAIYVILKN